MKTYQDLSSGKLYACFGVRVIEVEKIDSGFGFRIVQEIMPSEWVEICANKSSEIVVAPEQLQYKHKI